jgi:dienelactone hydrolase
MPVRRAAALVVAGWLLLGCAGLQGAAEALTETQEAASRGDLFKPAALGRHPAVVVLHGCNGVSERERSWARKLTEWGYVALVTDSFRPRGHGSICGTPQAVNVATRTGDVVRAVRWLNEQPFVQPGRIGLVGFSHGGSTALSAVQDAPAWSASRRPSRSIPGAIARVMRRSRSRLWS